MDQPTIAEERVARTMALFHGSKVIYVKPGGGMVTVAGSKCDEVARAISKS
jgi:hypothetical protein